jgi:hypothetical protein
METSFKYKVLQMLVIAEYTFASWLLLRIIAGITHNIYYGV